MEGTSSIVFEGLLVSPQLGSFWTEHSARATLPSWAACLPSVPDAWIDALGRWAAGRSKTYIRTYQKRVRFIQTNVAKRIKESADPHNLLDERALFVEFTAHLGKLGVEETLVANWVGAFEVYRPNRSTACLQVADASSDAEESAEEIEDCGLDEVVSVGESDVEVAGVEAFSVKENLGIFVVSLRRQSKQRRCLHRIGSCYRVPGKDYLQYEVLTSEFPASSKFDVMCKDCKLHSGTKEASSSSSSSSGSSASSSGSPSQSS